MEVKLTLNEQDLLLLDKALTQLPYGEVFQLIQKINEQIIEHETTDE